ncbi:MAG TPA: hypothetical protein VGK99_16750 [Acidobacteriota bacterium]|jgi:hypothetical protein
MNKWGRFTFIAVLLALGAFTMAKEFWEKPYTEWTKKDVDKMLHDSPWSKSQTIADELGGKGSGAGGDKELYNVFSVRFFSAMPVRQAYVRMMQLMNNYDAKPESEKAAIDAKFVRVLKIDFSKTIMVAFEYSTNNRERDMNIRRFLENSTTALLSQSCYLITDHQGRVSLQEYYPPSPDGTGAKFVFPRMAGEKAVVMPEDKEVKFDLYLQPLNQRVFITFKVKSMVVDGQVVI